MLNRILEQKKKIAVSVIIIVCFGLIRAFEKTLFYDPLLDYFETTSKNVPLPNLDFFKLFFNLLFRFTLNTILSLVLIYALFNDKGILSFSTFLYLFFGILLFGAFFIIVGYFPENSWLLFYVRRFIIQPIFVLLFIPAFYYQFQNFKK
ncbi:exosortase F-associated protein [Flavobacterium sp. HSC-32F16]|uniref:exosortase F system-associated membrane protein n=1 Tax=Flavobacterium sp. HSC-32F16 TaxID=2910964 RepID=UPI0020A26B6D|nr:exosortase F system-associated protein [Flavobacterium sp. HSC-32F16]MCP2026840.1 exosortase F-associated protein [Flavobacterium sp. HSC-32F16]